METDQKDAIAEAAIALAATKLHIDVYKPMAEGGRCDLILGIGTTCCAFSANGPRSSRKL